MIFNGTIDFEHNFSIPRHTLILNHFSESDDQCMEILWKECGYKSVKAARGSWYATIWKKRLPFDTKVESGRLFIIKKKQ